MRNRIHRTIVPSALGTRIDPRDSDQEAHTKLKHVRHVATLEFQGRNRVIDCVTDTEEEEVLDMISLEEIADCPVGNEVTGDADAMNSIAVERTQARNGNALGETIGQVSVMPTWQAGKAFRTQGDTSKGKTVTTSKNTGDDLRRPTVNTTHLETPNGRDVRTTVFFAS